MQAILVLNAGSSSLKFQIFAIDGDRLDRRVKGQIDGIGMRPRLKASGPDGAALVDGSSLRRSCPTFPPPRRAAALAREPRRLRTARDRPPRRARRARLRPAGAGRCGGPGAARPRSCRWRRCTSRTTSRRSGSRAEIDPECRRSPASTPPFTAGIRRTPTAMRCRARSTTRVCDATGSTASPTSMSPSGCARSRPTWPGAG